MVPTTNQLDHRAGDPASQARRPASGTTSMLRAVEALRAGQIVVVTSARRGVVQGFLMTAAERVTEDSIAFLVRYTSGFIFVPMTRDLASRLGLPPMVWDYASNPETAVFTVTVDASDGVSTGISARDRAHTIRVLASPESRPTDLRRPGHVVPLAVGGGATTGALMVALARRAGLRPMVAASELVSDRGPDYRLMVRDIEEFAADHGLVLVTSEQVAAGTDASC